MEASVHVVLQGYGIPVSYSGFLLDTGKPSSVQELASPMPSEVTLGHYPNPFDATTTIRFSLPKREHVALKVFDVLGREVATLAEGEWEAGDHAVMFDAGTLPSGVYVVRLQSGNGIHQWC